jgi:hypothetical protein
MELWYDTDEFTTIVPVTFSSGPEINRPPTSFANAGLRYFATDTQRDWLCDGNGWIIMAEPDQPYTPALVNVSLGSGGSNSGSYKRGDGYCDVSIVVGLGSTSAGTIGTGPTFSLPFPAHAIENLKILGTFSFYDATGPVFSLDPLAVTANVIEPRYRSIVSSGAVALGQISNTYPVAIGTGDTYFAKLRYRLASRYS